MSPSLGAASMAAPVYSRFLDPGRTWLTNRRIILLNCWILLLAATSSTNGFDSSMMNGLQSIPQWDDDFHHPSGGMLGLLTAIQNVGSLVAFPFAPRILDTYGRRSSMLIGGVIMCIATVVQTAAWSVGLFMAARFFIGFGLTFSAAAAPVLIAEISYPTYRAQFTSAYQSLWYLGSILAAWTTFFSFKINNKWAWRLPSLLQGLPSLIQLVFIRFAPESPRWLVSQHREQEALQTLAYYHGDGDEHDPLVRFEFDEIKAACDFDHRHKNEIGWKSLFATPANKKRMIVIFGLAFFSQWSGNGLVSYYLKRVLESIGTVDPNTQLLINGLLQVWNLCWALFASFLVDKAGRRFLFLTSAIGMLLFFALQTLCSATFAETLNPTAAHLDIVFIFLFYAAYNLAFTPLITTYTLEILPYHLRGMGFASFQIILLLSIILNQFINAIALDWIGWRYYPFYVVLLGFEVFFLYFHVMETKGCTLEETAALFDDRDPSADPSLNLDTALCVDHEHERLLN